MDKIWDRTENPSKSEVIGHCGGDENSNDHAESTKWNAKNNFKTTSLYVEIRDTTMY